MRREIAAAVMMVAALLSAWSLVSPNQDGRLVAWWASVLWASCGHGAFLVPVFLVMTAIRAFRVDEGPIILPRHYAGGLGFGLAVVGLIELAGAYEEPGDGGRLGISVAALLRSGLGEFGAGVVLLAAGVVGVFLLAGTDVRTFWHDLKRVWPRFSIGPADNLEEDRDDDEDEPARLDAVAQPARTPDRLHNGKSLPAVPPIINLPKTEPKPVQVTANSRLHADQGKELLPLPDLSRLSYYDEVKLNTAELEAKARLIEEKLASYKVEARVREINPGPAVTQFTLEPGVGVKVRRITELQNDLALALAAPSIRI
ncbi:MAG: DNA translocase FtsK, partial [Chloroflexota bacterium]